MKRFMFLSVLLLIVVFLATCCKEEKKARETSTEKRIEEKAENLLLAGKDVEAFIDAFPVFVEITRQKEKEVEPLTGKEDFVSGMRLAGEFEEYKEEIDAALKEYGFTLESFGMTYGKVMSAFAFGQMAGASEEFKKLLDNPNVPEEQKEEIRKSLEETEESPEMKACKENWEIVKKYQSELENLFKEK